MDILFDLTEQTALQCLFYFSSVNKLTLQSLKCKTNNFSRGQRAPPKRIIGFAKALQEELCREWHILHFLTKLEVGIIVEK